MADYAHPEVLVTTDWVLENKDKDGIKIVADWYLKNYKLNKLQKR